MGLLNFLKIIFPNYFVPTSQPNTTSGIEIKSINEQYYDDDDYVNDDYDKKDKDDTALPNENDCQKIYFPSANGLCPYQLSLLHSAKKYKLKYPDYDKSVLLLLDKDFLATDSVIPALSRAKVTELKVVLKSNNLKVSGNKAELISRLLDNVPDAELKKSFRDQYYSLTSKGENELNDNPYIAYVNEKSFCDLDIWEANILLHQNPGFSISDMSWRKFAEESKEYFITHEYVLYRNVKFNMAMQLFDEGRLDVALIYFFEVYYWDLSGMEYYFDIEDIESSMRYFFPCNSSSLTIDHVTIDRITVIKETLNLTTNNLKEIYFTNMNKFNAPFHRFTKEECIEIIMNELGDFESNEDDDICTNQKIKQIFIDAEKRFKEKYKLN